MTPLLCGGHATADPVAYACRYLVLSLWATRLLGVLSRESIVRPRALVDLHDIQHRRFVPYDVENAIVAHAYTKDLLLIPFDAFRITWKGIGAKRNDLLKETAGDLTGHMLEKMRRLSREPVREHGSSQPQLSAQFLTLD